LTLTTYVLPDSMRPILGRPLGELVVGQVDLGPLLSSVVAKERPTKLILVGDSVSRQTTQAGIMADVMIVDRLEKRGKAVDFAYGNVRVIKARNRPGRIELGAALAVERAIRGEAGFVEIDGEEDLLAIIAVIAAPLGSLVVYGQPNEGVVLVRVSAESKVSAEGLLGRMDRVSDD